LAGLSCLDLFAGSGALGFEAGSRGAAKVTMVEYSPKVFEALETNARLLDSQGCLQIVRADAVKFASSLRAAGSRFDVLFLDPPYKQGWIDRLMPLLPELVADDGVIYIEAEYALTEFEGWSIERSGRAGQVFYHLMRRNDPDGAE
jgi:16S rRNA (guanine966-N2)-methyltransferase